MTELLAAPDISTAGGLASSSLFPVTTSTGANLYKCTGAEIAAAYGGSGGSGALTKIAEQVLSSPASGISFTSINQSYEDIIAVIHGQGSAASPGINVFANGDTAAHYDIGGWNRFGNSQTYNTATPSIGSVEGSTVKGSYFSSFEIAFIGYTATNSWKRAISRIPFLDNSNFFDQFNGWGWQSTAAITQLDFDLASGNWVTGTRITLYGRG